MLKEATDHTNTFDGAKQTNKNGENKIQNNDDNNGTKIIIEEQKNMTSCFITKMARGRCKKRENILGNTTKRHNRLCT